jgi:hypothetical protein
MAPVPTQPRLADLDPEFIAAEACKRLIDHADVVFAGLTAEPFFKRSDITIHLMPFYSLAERLVRFAQTGEGAGPALLARFGAIFYGSAETPTIRPLGEADMFATIYLAAQARVDIARGAAVHHQALAALAGVHPSRVRQLSGGQAPTLHRSDRGSIQAKSARAWLQGQGVPGFEAPSRRRGPAR